MNFDELNKMVGEAAGVDICPICGCPFKKYHRRQKTCGSNECKKIYQCRYIKERREKQKAEDIEAYRAKRREAERKRYRKKKRKADAEDRIDSVQEYWDKWEEKDRRISGDDYGKKQAEKTLAQVPKINVDIGKECTKK